MTPQEFVAKWRAVSANEKKAYQQHFIDLCRLVGHPTPLEEDPAGRTYTFEAGADKLGGGSGWADVWKRGYFAVEYKGTDGDLDRAYRQLLQYRESLENPPLLVVCDLHSIAIHTNFTNTVKRVVRLELDDLLTPEGGQALHDLFHDPDAFRSPQTTAQVTEEAAQQFARLARKLSRWGHDSHQIAHFSIRLLFCLFAEDIGLLPKDVFTRLVAAGRRRSGFSSQLHQLFGAMAAGGFFGEHEIRHFDGGLFNNDDVLDMDSDALNILHQVSALDWSSLEPSIFGTLFTRSLDPAKRSQLGAQYTSEADILLIVEPVVMAPLRREWTEVKARARALIQKREEATPTEIVSPAERTRLRQQRTRINGELTALVMGFAEKLRTLRVLDPACGSGNFLYVVLRLLLDLEKEVIAFCGEAGIPSFYPQVSPAQLFGIEINEYAHELAQATVWIGYLQWLHHNGYGIPSEPILKPLDNIKNMDAILAYDADGNPVEPQWPEADVIVGNPPFLGNKRMRAELGDRYVEILRQLYGAYLSGGVDFVVYWFELARQAVEQRRTKRCGLLATQSIRSGANRVVLERILGSGGIFMAWKDREWIQEDAAVRVSMVGFDDGTEDQFALDGVQSNLINASLREDVDLTHIVRLTENANLAFQGPVKVGPFEIDQDLGQDMLSAPNPTLRPLVGS